MITIEKELTNKLLELLPTTREQAVTVYRLKEQMDGRLKLLSIITIRKSIKSLRHKWIPILWSSKGSYISYESNAIKLQKDTIDRMKAWFCIGMNKIKAWYEIALEDIIN